MEKIYISTLGCAKNLVDSEVMMGLLLKEGFEKTNTPEDAQVIVVNTCGFIESAKEESISEILEMTQYKKEKLKYLIVAGCLSQRYSSDLEKEIPEVDAFIGTTSFESIVQVLKELKTGVKTNLITDINIMLKEDAPREVSALGGLGYLKIAEGCDNLCTYCIIPKLRGKYRSRAIEDVLKEAKILAKGGIKELIVIAQDTTKYGLDNYGEKRLSHLLRELNKIEELKWIRVLYSYPEDVDMDFINAVAQCDKVLPYFDIPIQHGSNHVLKRMNRKTSKEQIREIIGNIRSVIPKAVIRTSIIVGFPGETKEQFKELCDFVEEIKFDRLGVFAYSLEEDTPAALLDGHMSQEEKEARKNELMAIQMEISSDKNQTMIGQTLEVVVEDEIEENLYEARTSRDMLEIDGIVYLTSKTPLKKGQYLNAKITDAMEYDLMGENENEYTK